VLAAQVTETPKPIGEVRESVPESLAYLVMRCLEKRPADRWQSAEELLPHLEALTTPSLGLTPTTMKPVPVGRRRWIPLAVIGVLAASLVGVGLMVKRGPGPQTVLPQPEYRQLTFDGNVQLSALSPDSDYLAYVVYGSPGKLMVQDLTGGTALTVADSIGWVYDLNWSADGTRVGLAGEFRGSDGVFLFPRLGGTPERAIGFATGGFTWSPDDARLAIWWRAAESGVQVHRLRSTEADSLPFPGTDPWVLDGDWSPQGELLALNTFSGVGSNLWVLDLSDGTYELTLADSAGFIFSPRWAPTETRFTTSVATIFIESRWTRGVDGRRARPNGFRDWKALPQKSTSTRFRATVGSSRTRGPAGIGISR
jgi:hypothetical protein